MKIAFPNDFSDRLSPMLVKELRQGLRTRSFIAVFLTLQIFLGVILLSAGTTSSSDHAGTTISNIIFIFFSIAVLVIQPMRGIGALSSEIKGNTIDMMVLTRLSAWRIVTGKWSAIVSQSGLILITIIPYLILRYFFGGMNLIGEMVVLFLIFLTSTALTAITVGLSATGSVILRSILPMIALPMGAWALLMSIAFSGRGGNSLVELCSLQTQDSRIAIGLYIVACVYYGFFLLSMGTSLIAPYADNYSTIRRLVALFVTLASVAICLFYTSDVQILIAVLAFVLPPIFTLSLTEFGILVPPNVQKFHRFGLLGKVTGFFLLPGWASGTFFCTLITAISLAGVYWLGPNLNPSFHRWSEEITVMITILSSLVLPALLINLFKVQGPSRIANYILISVATGILSATLLGIAESMSNPEFLWLFIWMPPIAISMLSSSADEEAVLIASIIIGSLYFLILNLWALRIYRTSIKELNHSRSQPVLEES